MEETLTVFLHPGIHARFHLMELKIIRYSWGAEETWDHRSKGYYMCQGRRGRSTSDRKNILNLGTVYLHRSCSNHMTKELGFVGMKL